MSEQKPLNPSKGATHYTRQVPLPLRFFSSVLGGTAGMSAQEPKEKESKKIVKKDDFLAACWFDSNV
jgi:hypothetical protein